MVGVGGVGKESGCGTDGSLVARAHGGIEVLSGGFVEGEGVWWKWIGTGMVRF